jgi:hypothetical protein
VTITYEWSFSQFDTKLSYDGLTDVVSVVHWRYTGTDETGVTASNYGTVTMPDPSPADFTPYQDITKELTIQWMQSVLDVPAIEASIASQIDYIKNPPVVPMAPPFDAASNGG